MERKIGEIFNYQDNLYQCIKSITCTNCGFNNKGCLADKHITGDCSGRLDGASVIFRKLEKIGNPIMVENKSYQKIKVPDSLCNNCAFYDNFSRNCKLSYYINHQPAYSCLKDEIFVEIKQNKENMERKRIFREEDMKNNPRFKHHKNIEQVINMQKMKPFDLEAAKAGKPVCTRDGRKVRIISFDRKFLFKGVSYPIIALVEDTAKEETIYGYNEKGKVMIEDDATYKDDLMMLPQKKEGWIIIHKEAIYDKETAEKIARETTANVIRIQKIEWEE